MSASTEKKNRQLAREAGTDKKILAQQEEAKKKAASKRRWTIGTVLVVLFIALILFLNSGYFHDHTDAVTISGESYSPAELNYYYASQFNQWYSTYGSYASMFGLDTANGLPGLKSQVYDEETGATWKDYFMEQTFTAISQEMALTRYAEENGIELDEEDIAEVEAQFEGIADTAEGYGYKNVDTYFAAVFGEGVDYELVREASLRSALASKAYTQYHDSLEYTDAQLEEHYQSLNGDSDVFDYLYYYLVAETVTTTAEDGAESSAPTEETLAAAKESADTILAAYEADAESADAEAALNAAIASAGIEATATHSDTATGSSLGDYKEWMMAQREAGDATVVEASSGNGYYIVVYQGRSDNHYPMAQVRHILIKAVADENGAYTDEAKAEAKTKAEEIYAQWQAGDATEDSFAALAEEMSEDTGSNTNGGLYENVAKNQMVEEFDKFCFEGHEKGDTAIVYGESGSYAGYHIMYYVGEGELYSNYIAENALLNDDMEAWMTEITEGYEATKGFGYRFTI